MASRAPPIPPAQRSSPGDKPHLRADGIGRHASAKDQGRGTQQNTHHSHQQDR
jgi:hypothetical protein